MQVPGGLVCALIVSALTTTPSPSLASALTLSASPGTLLASPGPADAAGDGSTAVLDRFVHAGQVSGGIEANIRKAVVRGLGSVRAVDPPAGSPAKPCTDAACTAALAAAGQAEYVVSGKIVHDDRDYELTLNLHGRDGRILATRSASCPICSIPDVEAAAARAAAELAADVPAKMAASSTASAETPLAITSCPSGARVYIDGALVGKTPFSETVAPGEHKLEIKAHGHIDQARTITIDPEAPPEAVAFALIPKRTGASLAPLGWAAIGLGVASVITGAALLAINDRPFKAYCEGENIDAAGRCRFQYDTLGGGIAGVVVGAALVGGGAALVARDRKRRGPGPRTAAQRTSRPSGPELRFGVHPRGVVLSGHF
jgi:hypothetical protein